MNPKIFKVTFRQQVLMLFYLILVNSILVSLCIYKFGWRLAIYWIIAIELVIDIIPTLIVHFQYLYQNSGLTLTVDFDNKYHEFDKKGAISKYSFLDISRLIRTSSYGRGTGWYSFAEYRYYKIIFNNNDKFIVTCLLVNNIEKNLIVKLGHEEEKKLKVVAFV